MLSWPGPDAALTMQSERTDPDVYLIDKAIELSVVAESASSRGQRSQQFHAGDPGSKHEEGSLLKYSARSTGLAKRGVMSLALVRNTTKHATLIPTAGLT